MALVCNVFEMLYQLANLDEPRIILRVRKLLLLIPTDPEVQDALDNFVPKESSVWSHQSMPTALDDDVIRDSDALSSRPFRNAVRSGRQLSLCGTPEKSSYRQMSLSERSSIRVEEIIPAARVAIQQLLDDFLFRASRIIINSSNATPSPAPSHDFHPKCSTASSRLAAYEVLVMLADSSLSNLRLITKELLSMHHQSDPSLCKEFDAFLSIEDDTDQPEESVFYQVQSLFGHLMESKLQYYVPENFWKIFKMWNKELYVREQQDAYEFFTSLVDQLDEHLKKMGREQIFKNTFQGIYSDQKICKDCPHRYEREETFMALNLGVTSCQSLEISLDQFVRGEVLEGSNAYY
ncbi:Ubiquitin carboxyl-terminal hydrolase 24, partial [Goodea atripinnis]